MTDIIAQRDGEHPADGRLHRDMTFEVRAEAVNPDARTVELSFSSDAPYERWWGQEILDHSAGSVRLDRLNGSAALLVNHEVGEHVGVVERAWVTGNKGRAIVRFGKSVAATEVFNDVVDGIRKLVSVGYRIHKIVLESRDGDTESYRVTDWEPFEISIVSIPADASVGVGRDGDQPAFDPRSLIIDEEEQDMTATRNANGGGAAPVVTPAAAAAAPAIENRSDVAPAPAVPAAPAAPQIDTRAAVEGERARIANLRAMGDRLNCRELADQAIADGRSVDAFVTAYNATAPQSQAIRTAESAEIGMSSRDLQRFSMLRLLATYIDPTNMALREAAAFEIEASNAALQRGHAPVKPGCIRVPHDVLVDQRDIGPQRRDLTVGTATAGGHLVATDLLSGNFIDYLVNAMSVTRMGATMLQGLNGNVAIPRATGGASMFWVAEGASVTASQPAFDQVALTPKTGGTFVDLSRQLLLQSDISVENFVRRDIALRIALGIDLAALNGSGSSNQPRGVLNTSGIGSVVGGTNGLAPTWDHIVDLETAVANANADMGSLGYLTNAKVRGKLKKTQVFTGTDGGPVWSRDAATPLNGYAATVSNQVPSNLTKGSSSGVCSAILFGNWADLIIGMWGGLDLMPNPYILSGTGSVRIEAYQTVDVSVRHPESFAAMVDALTA